MECSAFDRVETDICRLRKAPCLVREVEMQEGAECKESLLVFGARRDKRDGGVG